MTLTHRWRHMEPADLAAVERIAAEVHPDFFERTEVLAEKQQLYPTGSWFCEVEGAPAGYFFTHPWRDGDIPALDSFLGAIPADADTYYFHDLALLPAARGIGAAGVAVRLALAHAAAAGFRSASLVAVNNSRDFWATRGFAVVEAPHLAQTLADYEAAARLMQRALG